MERVDAGVIAWEWLWKGVEITENSAQESRRTRRLIGFSLSGALVSIVVVKRAIDLMDELIGLHTAVSPAPIELSRRMFGHDLVLPLTGVSKALDAVANRDDHLAEGFDAGAISYGTSGWDNLETAVLPCPESA